MKSTTANIFANIPDSLPDEMFQTLFKHDNVHIQRIISKGHCTPPGQWYDQEQDEWVILLQGKARILFENNQQTIALNTGDYLLIAAHTRHRVEWTDHDIESIWLAIHLY